MSRPVRLVPFVLVSSVVALARALTVAVAAGCASAAAPGPAPAPAPAPASASVTDQGNPEERARTAASALARDLMQRLGRALSEGGPAGAVDVCSTVAPELAAAHSKDGLAIRRVSARPRNVGGATPDAYEAAVLARLEADRAAGKTLGDVVEWQGDGAARELRFMRPIVIGKTCLACHGAPEAIDPAVGKVLAERYPADKAVGYREGDLRGAISVRVAGR